MKGSSKWVKWYRILAIIGCGVIALYSIINGWNSSRYTYNYGYDVGHDMADFLLRAGTGCAIAVVELIASMMLCEFLDNVSLIAYKLSHWNYKNAAKDFIEALNSDPTARERAKTIYHAPTDGPQATEKKDVKAEEKQEETERQTMTTNKDHAPVLPIPTKQGGNKVVCPLCGTEQRSNRRLCMNCAVPFITEE